MNKKANLVNSVVLNVATSLTTEIGVTSVISFHTQSDLIEYDDDFASCGIQANRCSLPPSPPSRGTGMETLIGLLSLVGGSRLTIGPTPGI